MGRPGPRSASTPRTSPCRRGRRWPGSHGTGFENWAQAIRASSERSAPPAGAETGAGKRAVVFIIFNGNFAPTGLSDPFHVTDADGRVQRTGTVVGEENGCVTFEDRDGYLYTLAGDLGDAEPGDSVILQGTVSRSVACPQADTIEVDSVQETEPVERPHPEPFLVSPVASSGTQVASSPRRAGDFERKMERAA